MIVCSLQQIDLATVLSGGGWQIATLDSLCEDRILVTMLAQIMAGHKGCNGEGKPTNQRARKNRIVSTFLRP